MDTMKFLNAAWPSVPGVVKTTVEGTPYLTEPGVALLARTEANFDAVHAEFLTGFDDELDFGNYSEDPVALDELPGGEAIAKFAGQLCYMSFGPNRTMNGDVDKYLENIKSSGHGSVLEHANFTFLMYGSDRSFTHELVRHRAGAAYSQVSQRYVDGKVLRFVEREEFQDDPLLHAMFMQRIDHAAKEYEAIAHRLMTAQEKAGGILSGGSKRDRRKKVNQAARACLPNETEAAIVMTGNGRAWRHVLEMRASEHADTQIRRVAMKVYQCLVHVAPSLFGDYVVKELSDGTLALETTYRKV